MAPALSRHSDPTVKDSTMKLPVVIRMSPMAHFATGFLALGILVMVPFISAWGAALLVIPVLGSLAIVRLRTEADRDMVTARSLFSSRTVAWEQIDGLRFTKSAWARACLRQGGELPLPAVTFATLPLLTAASNGRVPNPYQR
jgi:hypothetical protein